MLGSIRFEGARLLAGGVGLIVTLLLHLMLTRTAIGSRMLAVSEDATAAQLMGIRPERMQALAWALAGAATGIAGALIATFFYTSPTVGETLAIVAFVTVSLGGFGSVTGALGRGPADRRVRIAVAYLIGPVYKDVVVYCIFVLVLWFRPQGPDGQGVMTPRRLIQLAFLVLILVYPLLDARLGGLPAAGCAGAAGRRSAPRPGTSSAAMPARSSVGHAVFFGIGAYASVVAYVHADLPPIVGAPLGNGAERGPGRPDRRADAQALRPLFSMATIAVGELVRVLSSTSEFLGGAQGLGGPAMPRTVMDLSFLSAMPYYYIFLGVLAVLLGLTWWIERGRMGFYLRAIKDSERAARSLGVSAGRYKLYAYMLSAALHLARRLALSLHVRASSIRSRASAS